MATLKKRIAIPVTCASFFAIFIGLVSGYQILGAGRDYSNYMIFFDMVRSSSDYSNIQYRFEPGFTALVYGLVNLTSLSNALVYSLIVALFVFLKYSSIEYTKKYWIAILVFTFYFLARYVPLFEMTVLRASCALSLAFFVFMRKKSPENKVSEILILLCAVFFHYSSIVFLFIYICKPTSRSRIVLISAILFLVIFSTKSYWVSALGSYIEVFQTYQDFDKATFLPIPYALDIMFLLFILYYFDSADLPMRYATLGLAVSVAFHFSLLEYSMFAGRFRELLSVFILIYVVRSASYSNQIVSWYGTLLYVLLAGFLNLYAVFFYDPLFL